MGRMIGGVVVGFIGSIIGASILLIGLAAALGADGIADATDKTPTMMWIMICLIVSGATAFLGGAIARAIGKDKRTTYIYLGLIVALSIVGIAFAGGEPPKPPEGQPEPTGFLKTMMVMGEAQYHMPSWYMFVSPLVSLLGIALGGFNKSDFDKGSGSVIA